ncbi:hypothetical protein [Nocardioides dongkuii]|uniref:hypothetical protein n=1 Tax=Nocardioides dongkuii TaxID=2760089 RepID=UPI0015F857AC|nr:hypothetical protein [Nocardioides dongkuii]
MTILDLGSGSPWSSGILDALPRRLALTLPELQLVAAGGAPLPFDLDPQAGPDQDPDDQAAYAAALASFHDPVTSLSRRGLLDPRGAVDEGVAGAVGLLAVPAVAVDLELVAGGVHARAWHRQAADAVATLATVDGLVFELAWFPAEQWAIELARLAVLPEGLPLGVSAVPAVLTVPRGLADAATEAVHLGRPDLVDVLAARHGGAVLDGAGDPLGPAAVTAALVGLATEARGRLRALVADATGGSPGAVGVVSWTLLADGWHSLTLRQGAGGDRPRLEVRRVGAADLAGGLAPVLATVTGTAR